MSKVSRKQLWNAYFGNLFEHYDSALFGVLSSFLAPLIFPGKDSVSALILTYAMLPLGMLARPIGSLIFGYIGDAYGRSRALFLTLAGMSCVSGLMAFIPTYVQAGLLAPILFCFGRVMQNFFAAGETMGGAIFLLENSPGRHRDLLSGFYNTSTIGGHLLASLGVFVIGSYGITDPGWRVLYLCGCITALFGCLMRKEPKATRGPVNFFNTLRELKKTLWSQRRALGKIILVSGFASASYCVTVILMNGFVPLVSKVSKEQMMGLTTYLLVLDLLAMPFFGWVAFRFAREKVMFFASLGVVVFSIPLALMLEGATLMMVIGIRTCFVLMAVALFAPFHAWAQEMIPQKCRYAVISLGYAMGYQLLGSPSASLSLWIFKKTGSVSSIVWYWMGLGILSSLVLLNPLRNLKWKKPIPEAPL